MIMSFSHFTNFTGKIERQPEVSYKTKLRHYDCLVFSWSQKFSFNYSVVGTLTHVSSKLLIMSPGKKMK